MEAVAVADELLDRYLSLEGIFCALVKSLNDEPSLGHHLAKPDLAHQLILLARSAERAGEIDGRLFAYLVRTLGGREDEALLAIFFGPKLTCVDVQILAYGNPRDVSVSARRLLRAAVRCGAISFVLAHNHPSGNVQPSEVDYQSTRKAEHAARGIGLRLIDHFVVAGEKIFSMRHAMLMQASGKD